MDNKMTVNLRKFALMHQQIALELFFAEAILDNVEIFTIWVLFLTLN